MHRCIFARSVASMPINFLKTFSLGLLPLLGLVMISMGNPAHAYQTAETSHMSGPILGQYFNQPNSIPVDSTASNFPPTNTDSLFDANSPTLVPAIVVPPEWKIMVQSDQTISTPDTRRAGLMRKETRTSTTTSFLLFMFGLLLLAVDRQRFLQMSGAFVLPRLFEQFLRQQGNSLGSGWSIARVLYLFILIASCWVMYQYRMINTLEKLTLEGFQFLGFIGLTAFIFLTIHIILGMAFSQIEWTISHVQTTWVYFQCAIPIFLTAVLLLTTLPMKYLSGSMFLLTILLLSGWVYRCILGWLRAFHIKGVGLGFIIFYFCLFEFLPLLLFLKLTFVHLI